MTENWFRWHVGTASDPKWLVVAARSGQSVAVVLGVWAAMLERAAEQGGTIAGWDHEDAAAGLGITVDDVLAVFEAMQGKTLFGVSVLKWRKRQPLREDHSTDRVRAFRDRKRNGDPTPPPGPETGGTDETQGSVEKPDETQRNAVKRDETLEERRGDKNSVPTSLRSVGQPAVSAVAEAGQLSPVDRPIVEVLFGECLRYLTSNGIGDKPARSLMGKWRKQYGDGEVAAAIAEAQHDAASEPVGLVTAILQRRQEARARGSPSRHPYAPTATASGMMKIFADKEQRRDDQDRGRHPPGDDDEAPLFLPAAGTH